VITRAVAALPLGRSNGIVVARPAIVLQPLRVNIMWYWIACLVTGHDYSVSCNDGSMFLKCLVCGRRSHGWTVAATKPDSHVSRV
jgi:hypothetical protein